MPASGLTCQPSPLGKKRKIKPKRRNVKAPLCPLVQEQTDQSEFSWSLVADGGMGDGTGAW